MSARLSATWSGQAISLPSDGVTAHQSVGKVRDQSDGVVCSQAVPPDQWEGVVDESCHVVEQVGVEDDRGKAGDSSESP